MLPENKIICGDNVEVLKTFPDDCIDLVVTSPPYDDLRTYAQDKPMSSLWDFEGLANQLWRVLKPGGVIVWVVADATANGSETGTSFRQALRFMGIGFRLHDTMIWDKGGFSAVGSTSVRYGPVSEFMFVFVKGKIKTFNPIYDRKNICKIHQRKSRTVRLPSGEMIRKTHTPKRSKEYGIRWNIWCITPAQNDHPAPFPEVLAADHIRSWSNKGGIVLDPFSGSGTTAKMAMILERKYIGIEVNPDYVKMSETRLKMSKGLF